ncbi:helix-turn-helix transcriptional regulator [Blastococcus deserti]|uniref:Response regulator transcription factor n=1 Tax=Blastococcus deserti TaxID=2259033 RepID=A0ABW4X5J3_9ACTN
MATRNELERRRDEVLRVCERPGTAEELFRDLLLRLRRLVPFTGSLCFGLDPATHLATAPALIDGVHASHCGSFWPREFLVEDTNLFLAMARTQTAAAGLVEATGARPVRSARYREFMAPQGYGDELRAVLRAERSAWGSISLYRPTEERPFSPDEIAFVAGLTRPVAEALRARLVAERRSTGAQPHSPGVVLFDGSGNLLNANDAARAWFDELPDVGIGAEVPSPVRVLLAHGLAVAEGHERGPARMRLRTGRGRWLVLHASHLPGAAGTDDLLAVVVEPATSAEVAPIIVEAYALTPREQDIISALARGLGTAEMAQQLFLSAHTVRDHVKSVFAKLGVSTRGELVAKLFAEHYEPALEQRVTRMPLEA